MPTAFGPQLIGETEKTLNALLRRLLDGTGLTEPQWVTLRLAGLLDGTVDGGGLAAAVLDRAHFADASDVVGDLTARGLLDDGRLTSGGRDLLSTMQATIAAETAPIWDDLPAADVAATARVLDAVVTRARGVLGDLRPGPQGEGAPN
jgi:hypothetical protein